MAEDQSAPPSEDEKLQAARERIAKDPLYPQFHVAPPGGWMNDPHPIYFKGAYHIFYQYSHIMDVPYGGPHRWGHAMSTDLIHWKHLPEAITPKDHGIAEDRHIWSGCLVDNNGVGTAIYTIENIDVYISTSTDDDLRTFKKYAGNPVIKGPPPGLGIDGGMRDPWVWKEGDTWYLIVGSGLKDHKGLVLPLYRSKNLTDWEYLHPLYQGDRTKGDITFCECPSFFPLGDKHVLALSHLTTYMVGRYEDHRFIPEKRGRLDYGRLYVPQFVRDDQGRWIMWGWVLEARSRAEQVTAGWASMQTVPRVVSLGPDGMLRFDPPEEYEALRREHRSLASTELPADTTTVLDDIQGAQLEIQATFEPGGAQAVGIALFDGAPQADILYDAKAGVLRCKDQSAPFRLADGETLDLRVFVDGSVVEVFGNRRVCLTERIYPAAAQNMKVGLMARGGQATARKLDVWKLGSIWPAAE
jgi:beta-fructofuranosidase